MNAHGSGLSRVRNGLSMVVTCLVLLQTQLALAQPRTSHEYSPAIAKQAWAKGLVYRSGSETIVAANTEDWTPAQKRDAAVGGGASVVLVLLTVGLIEAFKTDCPPDVTKVGWDSLAVPGTPADADGDVLTAEDYADLAAQFPNGVDMPKVFPGSNPPKGQIELPTVPPDMIGFDLWDGSEVTWKKVMMFGDTSSKLASGAAVAEGGPGDKRGHSGPVFVPATSNLRVTFVKGKRRGNMCQMVEIDGIDGLKPGHYYKVEWKRD